MSLRSNVIFLVIILLLFGTLAARGDWKDRLLVEAPEHWKELDRFATQVEGSLTLVETDNYIPPEKTSAGRDSKAKAEKPKYPRKTSERFFINGTLMKTIHDMGASELIAGSNRDYDFVLGRKKDRGDFRIHSVKKADASLLPKANKSRDYAERDLLARIRAPWSMLGHTLLEWTRTPGFVIQDVSPVKQGGIEQVKVNFAYASTDQNPASSISRGFVVVNPEKRWRIAEFRAEKQFGTISASLTYGEDDGELPRLREQITTLNRKNGSVFVRTLTFQRLEHRVLPEKEFMISHYDLPEPTFNEIEPSFPYWLLILGLWMAAVSYYLSQKRRGSQVRPSATPKVS